MPYLSLSGSLLLMINGWVDFTFEWELLIINPSSYPVQFLQKGTLKLSYDIGNKLYVTIGSTSLTFSSITTTAGLLYLRSVIVIIYYYFARWSIQFL